MKVIRKIDDEIKEVNYPHVDIATPVAGLANGIIYYFIINEELPAYNTDRSYVKPTEILTDEIHPDYSHLLIARRGYEIVDYPQSVILNKLTESMGSWIDERLDVNKKVKYLSRYIYLQQLEAIGGNYWNETLATEKKYLEDVDTWYNQMLIERDKKENEFINNGIFPDLYNWEEMPIKPF